MEAGKERLARDTVWDTTRTEIDKVNNENAKSRQLAAELSLRMYLLKKRLRHRGTVTRLVVSFNRYVRLGCVI